MADIVAAATCQGKDAYATKAKATEVVARRARRARHHRAHKERRREIATLAAYRCRVCHHWHIGAEHKPKEPR